MAPGSLQDMLGGRWRIQGDDLRVRQRIVGDGVGKARSWGTWGQQVVGPPWAERRGGPCSPPLCGEQEAQAEDGANLR